MNLTSKIQSVTSNPAMLGAYARWVGSRLFSGKAPRITLPGGAHVGEWLSFSEFWSFQNIIPEPERLFVERCLANKSGRRAMAFDIGANVGAFTCLMASLGHTIHSFEPIPETFCRLKNNVKSNRLLDRAHLNCLAVGKEQGLVTFHIAENAAATNRMVLPGESRANNASSTQLVATISLDDYCDRQGIKRVDLVKLDVEGMEPYVLQGANALLKERKVAAFLIEICPVNLRAVGLSPAELYREFETARYSPYGLNDDGRPGAKLSLAEIEAMPIANVVLLPDA
jgi:FkbM family methyltransferase